MTHVLYADGWTYLTNPSTKGGYVVTTECGEVLVEHVYESGKITNNEAEFFGIVHALQIANPDSTIYSDSRCAISWAKKGKSNARKDLNSTCVEAKRLMLEKHITLCWSARDTNLAGRYIEDSKLEGVVDTQRTRAVDIILNAYNACETQNEYGEWAITYGRKLLDLARKRARYAIS